jgi:hypothetical protein
MLDNISKYIGISRYMVNKKLNIPENAKGRMVNIKNDNTHFISVIQTHKNE